MDRKQLRKETLELDAPTDERKRKFQAELYEALHKPLKTWERAVAAVLVPTGLLFTVFCVWTLYVKRAEFSTLIQMEVALAALVGLWLAGWGLRGLWTGCHLRNERLFLQIGFGIFVAMIAASIVLTGSVPNDLLAATMLIGFVFTWDHVRMAELRIREGILRQRLQFMELLECMDAQERGPKRERS